MEVKILFIFLGGSIGRLAVPFFMCTTSYFLYLKNPSQKEVLKIIIKTLKIWIFWMILYLPLAIILLKNSNLKIIVFQFFKGILGVSINYGGSWYLVATALGIFVIWYLKEKEMYKIMYFFSFFIFMIGLSVTSYGGWISPETILYKLNEVLMPANTIVMGIPWICLGFLFSKKLIIKRYSILFLLLVVTLPMIEFILINKYNLGYVVTDGRVRTDFMFSLPVSLYLLFSFFNSNFIKLDKSVSKFLRDSSTLFYFIHFGVNNIFSRMFDLNLGFF